MPLSDHEQRILDEIEKNLYQEDPGFARQVKERADLRDARRRVWIGALCFVTGFAGLLLFFYLKAVLIGVAAFAAMVFGIVLVAGAARSLLSENGVLRSPRERVANMFSDWEERVRQRYKNED